VTKEIHRLQKLVGKVVVQCNLVGATISVDGKAVGKSPLAQPIFINSGVHSFEAFKDDLSPVRRTITVGAGDTLTIQIKLVKRKKPVAIEPGQVISPKGKPLSKRFWIAVGTVALAVGAGVLGGLLEARSDLDVDSAPTSAETRARSKLKTRALATDLLIGAAAIAAGLTTYFFFADRARKERPSKKSGLNIKAIPMPNGFSATGQF
jgi:hypothetical protein